MSQSKSSGPNQPRGGDLVRLPHMPKDTLALVVVADYKAGQMTGLYYLPVRVLNKEEYRGKNLHDEVYHISKKDLEEIRDITKRGEFHLDMGTGKDAKVLRMSFDAKHYEFDKDTLPEIFFNRQAQTYGTNFWSRTIKVANRLMMAKQEEMLQVEETAWKVLPRKRSPGEVEATRPSGVTVKDLTLADAFNSHYISRETYDVFSAVIGAKYAPQTLGEARRLTMSDKPAAKKALAKAFDSSAVMLDEAGWDKGEILADLQEGWKEFMHQVVDTEQFDLNGLRVDHAPRRYLG